MKLRAYGQTHPGLERDNNEDALLVNVEAGLFVVADGMAGHRYGELASAICVDTLKRFFETDKLDNPLKKHLARAKLQGQVPQNMPYQQFKLKSAIEEGNRAIFETATKNPEFETMGTTVVGAIIVGKSIFLAHVGDSRIYRFRRGQLEQVTHDHSLLNEYLKLNLLSPEEAEAFPMKNVIVRALGLADHVEVELGKRTAQKGDRLMLCSDGLSDLVKDEKIAEVFEKGEEPRIQVETLIQLALDAGGLDNVTVLVAEVEDV